MTIVVILISVLFACTAVVFLVYFGGEVVY